MHEELEFTIHVTFNKVEQKFKKKTTHFLAETGTG
jgi:hypothetical protein